MTEEIKDITAEIGLKDYDISRGLTSEVISDNHNKFGRNVITQTKKNTALSIFLKQLKNFIIIVLILAAIISLIAHEYINFYVISFISILIIILGFVQEYRAEKSLEALKKLIKPTTKVIREGKRSEVSVEDIVPGDLLYVEAGDRIAADAYVVENNSLKLEESQLTGESLPVEKGDYEKVFAGTQVVYGNAKLIVSEIGMNTEIGKIAGAIQEQDESTPLQNKINNLTKSLAIIGFFVSIIAGIIGFISGGEVNEVLILSLTLAVATIPEGLPLTLTITLTHGTRLLAQKNALIRKLVGVETLGSASVICTDKTGTLTENKMTVKKLYLAGEEYEIKGNGYSLDSIDRVENKYFDLFSSGAIVNNNSSISITENEAEITGDPTEASLLVLMQKFGVNVNESQRKYERLHEFFFTSERKMMSVVTKIDGKTYLFSKGAPEVIINKSDKYIEGEELKNLNEESKSHLLEKDIAYSSNAYRVIGFSYKELEADNITDYDKQVSENEMTFLGMVAMIDPPREESIRAVRECKMAGIDVVMITGDSKDTGKAIAKQVGIIEESDTSINFDNPKLDNIVKDSVITGQELESLSEEELSSVIKYIKVYARVKPSQKLRIVESLKSLDEVVAMTGDGVNDAPALKKADIGIAMGITGTDVSKQSAVIILEDDNFATIVEAVKQGRGIFENIEKFITYLVSQNFNEIILIILALLFYGPELLPLTPLQILFINTFDEIIPSLSLGFDRHRKSIMKDKPRSANESLLNRYNLLMILSTSIFMALASFFAFNIGNPDEDIDHARTLVFLSISLMIILRPFSFKELRNSIFSRSLTDNWLMIFGSIFALIVAIVLIYFAPLQSLIGLSSLTLSDWLLPLLIAIASTIWIEITKYVARKITN